jgi:hypothetical protein
MQRSRVLVTVISGLSLFILAGFGPPKLAAPQSRPAELHTIKLGFSYLSSAQVKDLWHRADRYAEAEAFLRHCGSPSHIERRMTLAARDCIERSALQRVAGYFRRKMTEFSTTKKFICDTPEAKRIAQNVRAQIDRDVAEVRSMCNACIIC